MTKEPASTTRKLRKWVEPLLRRPDFAKHLDELNQVPARKIINPLFSLLCHSDEILRWRAITAIGQVVSGLAEEDLESARVIMRRFMWNLNDESGGIGWGAPEAMGEIMARHEKLAAEYGHILVSFIREDGNYLENPLLQRGILWGLGRMAQTRPHLLRDAPESLLVFLDSADPTLRGLAARVLGLLQVPLTDDRWNHLAKDFTPVRIYQDCRFQEFGISDLITPLRSACPA